MSEQQIASKFAPDPCVTLSVDLKHDGAVLAVSVSGELDLATTGVLEEAMSPYQGLHTSVSYDLRHLTFLDCAGLRALLAPADGDPFSSMVSMTNASRSVRHLLELLQLQSILDASSDGSSLDTSTSGAQLGDHLPA